MNFSLLSPQRDTFSKPRPSLKSLKFLKLWLLIVPITLILLVVYLYFPNGQAGGLPIYEYIQNVGKTRGRESFVREVLEHDVDGPYRVEPLQELCKSLDYQPGLIVKCEPPRGGFGNVKFFMLNCFRFAFEAGASGLIVPEIEIRDQNDLKSLSSHTFLPFSYLFNLQHFTRSFESGCPSIKLYQSAEEVLYLYPDIHGLDEETAHKIDVWDIWGAEVQAWPAISIVNQIEKWRPALDQHFLDTGLLFSATSPTVLTIFPPHLRFPMTHDAPDFIATFGRLLQSRDDVRTLAANVLYALNEKYALHMEPKHGLEAGKFYGMHLRTSEDALAVGWPGYDIQSSNYMLGAAESGLQTIYMATGNLADAARFTDLAATKAYNVTMKSDLLSAPIYSSQLAIMQNMTWDQQGMIDYEVLLRASKFGGMFESSFAWAVSNRRHVVEGEGQWVGIDEQHRGLEEGDDGPKTFEDGFSTVFGPKDMNRKRWQFVWAMWP